MDVFDLSATLTLDSSKYESALDKAENESKGFGSRLSGALKTGAAAFAVLTTAAAGVTAAFIKGANSVADYGDKVDKMSQKIGISAESYQKWDYVMQRAGGNVDSLKMGMKTLSQQAEKNSDAFQKLGISQEEVANLSQEELFERTVLGLSKMEAGTERATLATELLGRAGVDLGPLLNQGSDAIEEQMEIAEKYGMIMPDATVKASAAFKDSLTTMQMTMQGLKNRMLGEFLPAMTQVTDGLGKLFMGDMSGADDIAAGIEEIVEKVGVVLPQVLSIGGEILGQLAGNFVKNVPSLISSLFKQLLDVSMTWVPKLITGAQTILTNVLTAILNGFPKIVEGIKEKLPTIIDGMLEQQNSFMETGMELMSRLAEGIANALPNIVRSAIDLVVGFVKSIGEMLPNILASGARIVASLIKGILSSIPALLSAIPKVISAIWDAIRKTDWIALGKTILKGLISGIGAMLGGLGKMAMNIPKRIVSGVGNLYTKGRQFIADLWNGIRDRFSTLFTRAKEEAGKIPQRIKEGLGSLWSVGRDLIQGLWDGIKSKFDDAIEWVKGKASDMVEATKGTFRTHSPSRVFREIGQNIDEGLLLGLKDGWDEVQDAADALTDKVMSPFGDITLEPLGGLTVEGDLQGMTNATTGATITNYITVDGAENPEDWANRLVREMSLEMRMV